MPAQQCIHSVQKNHSQNSKDSNKNLSQFQSYSCILKISEPFYSYNERINEKLKLRVNHGRAYLLSKNSNFSLQRSISLLRRGNFSGLQLVLCPQFATQYNKRGLTGLHWCEIETKSSEKLLGSPPLRLLASLLVGGYLK